MPQNTIMDNCLILRPYSTLNLTNHTVLLEGYIEGNFTIIHDAGLFTLTDGVKHYMLIHNGETDFLFDGENRLELTYLGEEGDKDLNPCDFTIDGEQVLYGVYKIGDHYVSYGNDNFNEVYRQ